MTRSLDDLRVEDPIFRVRAKRRPRRDLLRQAFRDDGARQFRHALVSLAEARDGFLVPLGDEVAQRRLAFHNRVDPPSRISDLEGVVQPFRRDLAEGQKVDQRGEPHGAPLLQRPLVGAPSRRQALVARPRARPSDGRREPLCVLGQAKPLLGLCDFDQTRACGIGIFVRGDEPLQRVRDAPLAAEIVRPFQDQFTQRRERRRRICAMLRELGSPSARGVLPGKARLNGRGIGVEPPPDRPKARHLRVVGSRRLARDLKVEQRGRVACDVDGRIARREWREPRGDGFELATTQKNECIGGLVMVLEDRSQR